jgi:hypothetical protein
VRPALLDHVLDDIVAVLVLRQLDGGLQQHTAAQSHRVSVYRPF